MTHKVIFNSATPLGEETVGLASGYISQNQIAFINENITVHIEAKTGEVEFYDAEGNKCLSAKVPTPASGDEKYSELKCSVAGSLIKLGFPEYTYEDNYPHCDGEHDRWTKTISGFRFLCYDFKNNCIVE